MKLVKLMIRKNKANNQFNLSPRKTEWPKEIIKKMEKNKCMEIDLDEILFN